MFSERLEQFVVRFDQKVRRDNDPPERCHRIAAAMMVKYHRI